MTTVRRIVDLSLTISSETQVYPGDPVPVLTRHCTVERDGYNILHVSIGSQTGTHVDAPSHLEEDNTPIDRMDLALFVGRGVLFDVRGLVERTRITAAMIADTAATVRPGDIALIHTGWSRYYGSDAYYDHPFLDIAACDLLLERGVRTFCLDAASIDETPDDEHLGAGYPVHHKIANAGGVIGENFCNLELVDFADPFVTILPIKLQAGDGAPVRAVAMELDQV